MFQWKWMRLGSIGHTFFSSTIHGSKRWVTDMQMVIVWVKYSFNDTYISVHSCVRSPQASELSLLLKQWDITAIYSSKNFQSVWKRSLSKIHSINIVLKQHKLLFMTPHMNSISTIQVFLLISVFIYRSQEEKIKRASAPEKLTFKERQRLFSLASSA